MSTITLSPTEIGARIRADQRGTPRIIKQAMFSAAQRGRSWMVGKSPVDRGILRNAWKVIRISEGAELVNDQPYAGVLERGARPFKISREGLEALAGWVKRKILSGGQGRHSGAAKRHQLENRDANKKFKSKKGVQGPKLNTNLKSLRADALEKEAMSIAYAIAKKWEKVGKKGTRFVYSQIDKLAFLFDAEINRFLQKFFDRTRKE